MIDIAIGPVTTLGGEEVASDSWKRAVMKRAPRLFTIQMLSPFKTGSGYMYGMRITAVDDDRTVSSRASVSLDYEIWRRWEDFLWFQNWLETEYGRLARSKRRRLAAGRGLKERKSEGIYLHPSKASSFESLPPGPDPTSVAIDIHQHVPTLSKEGTVFRETQAIANKRQAELKEFLPGLFGPDQPALITQLLEDQSIADFFSYWRKDHDQTVKRDRAKLKLAIEGSTPPEKSPGKFSVFKRKIKTPTTPSTRAPRSAASYTSFASWRSPLKTPSLSSLNSDDTLSPIIVSPDSDTNSETETFSPMAGSDSSDSSSTYSYSPPPTPDDLDRTVDLDDTSIFLYNPSVAGSDKSSIYCKDLILDPIPPMSALNVSFDDARYSRQTFSSSEAQDRYLNRMSWATTTSASTTIPAEYLNGLDIYDEMPDTPTNASKRVGRRDSMCSVATFRTDCSANAVLPRDDVRKPGSKHRRPTTLTMDMNFWSIQSVSFDSPTSEESDDEADNDNGFINDFFDGDLLRPASMISHLSRCGDLPSSVSETYDTDHLPSFLQRRAPFTPHSARTKPPLASPISSSNPMVSIKVSHNDCIIAFRVARTITLEELRQLLYSKFADSQNGDKFKLAKSFALAWMPVNHRESSISELSVSSEKETIYYIHTEGEWEYAVAATPSGKLNLKAMGDTFG